MCKRPSETWGAGFANREILFKIGVRTRTGTLQTPLLVNVTALPSGGLLMFFNNNMYRCRVRRAGDGGSMSLEHDVPASDPVMEEAVTAAAAALSSIYDETCGGELWGVKRGARGHIAFTMIPFSIEREHLLVFDRIFSPSQLLVEYSIRGRGGVYHMHSTLGGVASTTRQIDGSRAASHPQAFPLREIVATALLGLVTVQGMRVAWQPIVGAPSAAPSAMHVTELNAPVSVSMPLISFSIVSLPRGGET
ncbi:Hypothetical protein, putative [Bodo saltans]|uniref:Uncharacterized protein n=1 Tax=Bodo saltans TaxID=75058 RepID=A0A0S4IJN1_BODSA|nr:Hypothetical protein, putative [Bodo saltans]|eukprot:CUE56105.1 Hypothetical protein, putative [Bodo saltans]